MGASENKQLQVQSQPILPAYSCREEDFRNKGNRVPLTKKEIVANFIDSLKKIEEDKKEMISKGPKAGLIKVKKVKQIMAAQKQNEWEEQQVQGVMFKTNELPQQKKINKKADNAQLYIEFKTTPVVGPSIGENELRTKKYRISKML